MPQNCNSLIIIMLTSILLLSLALVRRVREWGWRDPALRCSTCIINCSTTFSRPVYGMYLVSGAVESILHNVYVTMEVSIGMQSLHKMSSIRARSSIKY